MENALDQLVIIQLNANIWSAKSKLAEDDLSIEEMPSNQLVKLGTKSIANPQTLKIFGAIKARAVSFLSKNAIQFLGGYAIPRASLSKVVIVLQDLQLQFNEAKKLFLQNYESNLTDWLKVNKDFSEIIERSMVSASFVEKRIGFSFRAYRVSQACEIGEQEFNDTLNEDVKQLGLRLFHEISKQAQAVAKKSYDCKDRVSRKALSPLKILRDKLNSLSFIDERAEVLVGMIDQTLSKIPAKGSISGNALKSLKGLIALLSDQKRMLLVSQAKLNGLEVV
jgi:hypothetical protein